MGLPAAIPWIIAGADLLSGASKQGEANDLQKQAIELALLDRKERAPLREAFIPNATRPIASAPDLGYLTDTGNPFSSQFARTSSPHVPSQLQFAARYGNGTTVDGPGPQLPTTVQQAQRQVTSETSSLPPYIQKQVQRTLARPVTPRDPAEVTKETSHLPPYLQKQIQRTLQRPTLERMGR